MSKLKLVDMGNIGFSREPNIGTHGCGPCLGMLMKFTDIYACAHFSTVQQITTFKGMYDAMRLFGHVVERVVTFQEVLNSKNAQAFKEVIGESEFFRSDCAAYVNGSLKTVVPVPIIDPLELDCILLGSMFNFYENAYTLHIQFKPDDFNPWDTEVSLLGKLCVLFLIRLDKQYDAILDLQIAMLEKFGQQSSDDTADGNKKNIAKTAVKAFIEASRKPLAKTHQIKCHN